MAEIVNEMQERLLPEYEQLKKFEICTEDQIRDCMRKRESLQLKITQNGKSIKDYADFIIYERKVYKWVTEKETATGTEMGGLKRSIATRIIRLYRDALRCFPHEERFWDNFINFSKKSVPNEVLGIYEKMLTFHGDKPHVWCDAALWAYEYSLNVAKVKDIFYRALQRHKDSEFLHKTFFDILLIEASKMDTVRNLDNNTKSEQDMGLEFVKIVYRNSKNEIGNISFYLSLLERCEEPKFRNMTALLQKMILDDMMDRFPTNELLWNCLAQRELKGLNMSDLKDLEEKGGNDNTSTASTNDGTEPISEEDNKDNIIGGVFQTRTLKRRINLCVDVYKAAIRTLRTPEMCSMFINAMLNLNQDMSTQAVLKRKCLAMAFRDGHDSGLMSIDHYSTYIEMLFATPDSGSFTENILKEANEKHKSPVLFDLWLSLYILENDEPKVHEVFKKAHNVLGVQSVPIWQKTIQFYKTRYEDCEARLLQIYRDACLQTAAEFSVFRADFMEYCLVNKTMAETREEYDKLCELPPPSLDLHRKMADIESRLVVRKPLDVERWRLCYENATFYFGKTHIEVWLDYLKFERDNGEPKRLTLLYTRAKNTLDSNFVDEFIKQYSILTTLN